MLCYSEKCDWSCWKGNSDRSYSKVIFFYSTIQKVTFPFELSTAIFGRFVYSLHDVPIECVCCQLSVLLVDSWHGWPSDFFYVCGIFVNSGGAEVQFQALRHEGQARPGEQHNTEHAELRFFPEIFLLQRVRWTRVAQMTYRIIS